MLLARDALAIDLETHQTGVDQATDEEAAAPAGESVAGIELGTGRCYDGIPVVLRLLEAAWSRRCVAHRVAGVFQAVGLDRPAVVLPALDQVELVTAARAVLDDPEAALRVECGRLHVSVTARPDLRLRTVLVHKGIVVRHGAVRVDAQDLAEMAVELLRKAAHLHVRSLTRRDEQLA